MFKEIPVNLKSTSQRKPVYGVGINDAEYVVSPKLNGRQVTCIYYRVWKDMLARCYSSKTQAKYPTYKGCSTCDEWLVFSVFKDWMKAQDWKGNELDKDILKQGNKIYSPKTCLFLTHSINSLLNTNKTSRGIYPIGVSYHKATGKYQSNVNINDKLKYLGLFKTVKLAREAYKTAKYANIKAIALQQTEPLRTALLSYKI